MKIRLKWDSETWTIGWSTMHDMDSWSWRYFFRFLPSHKNAEELARRALLTGKASKVRRSGDVVEVVDSVTVERRDYISRTPG